MDCYTVWCGPCKGLSENIFPQEKVGEFFNANFINVKYDMEKGDGKMLNEKYKENIIGYPTLLLIDADGKVVHQMAGYQEADALVNGMKAALEGNTLFSARARYEAGARDLQTVAAYIDALNGAAQTAAVNEIARDFLTTIPPERLNEEEVWRVAGKQVKDPYSEHYKFVISNRSSRTRFGGDRYAIEAQLLSGMQQAVDEIVRVTRASTNPDTLAMMQERETLLKDLLSKHAVREFPSCIAKLRVNDLLLAGNLQEANDLLRASRELGLLRYQNSFLADTYRLLLERARDKKLLRSALAELNILQERQPPQVEFAHNYYDLIAAANDKLGQRDAARAAREEFERRDNIRKERVAKIFGKLLESKEETK